MSLFKKSETKNTNRPEIMKPKTLALPESRSNESNRSVVGKTVHVKGNLFAEEEILILGQVEGKLSGKNLVVVGKTGVVNADIDAREIIIKGTVNGNVKGSYKVEIVPDGVLNGNILSLRVVLSEGAIFKGNIDMTLKEDKNS